MFEGGRLAPATRHRASGPAQASAVAFFVGCVLSASDPHLKCIGYCSVHENLGRTGGTDSTGFGHRTGVGALGFRRSRASWGKLGDKTRMEYSFAGSDRSATWKGRWERTTTLGSGIPCRPLPHPHRTGNRACVRYQRSHAHRTSFVGTILPTHRIPSWKEMRWTNVPPAEPTAERRNRWGKIQKRRRKGDDHVWIEISPLQVARMKPSVAEIRWSRSPAETMGTYHEGGHVVGSS